MIYWAAMILGSSSVFVIEAVKSWFKEVLVQPHEVVHPPPPGVRF
jgi:hypothetical protein